MEEKRKSDEESMVSSDSTPTPEKASYSTAMIPDIDAEDCDNPLQAADYVLDIYKYLFWLEVRWCNLTAAWTSCSFRLDSRSAKISSSPTRSRRACGRY